MNLNDNELYVEFGKRLKDLRIAHGYTQVELAKAVNLSQTAIVQYESGSRRIPLKTLKVFSKFYGLTLDELIEPNETVNSAESENLKQPITKYEVATEIGFTKEEISILESGTRQIPKLFLEKLANYFNVDIEELETLRLSSKENSALITTDPRLSKMQGKWFSELGHITFSEDEIDQLIDYAKYLLSKRK